MPATAVWKCRSSDQWLGRIHKACSCVYGYLCTDSYRCHGTDPICLLLDTFHWIRTSDDLSSFYSLICVLFFFVDRSLPKLASQDDDGGLNPLSQYPGVGTFEPIPHDHDFCDRVVINVSLLRCLFACVAIQPDGRWCKMLLATERFRNTDPTSDVGLHQNALAFDDGPTRICGTWGVGCLSR